MNCLVTCEKGVSSDITFVRKFFEKSCAEVNRHWDFSCFICVAYFLCTFMTD